MKEEEYTSLRDEILQWQTRRLTMHNYTMVILIAYIGWFLTSDLNNQSLTWQLVSIFPQLLVAMTMHLNRIFEAFTLKISSFLAVYHDSEWENENRKLSVEASILKLGFNNTFALTYLTITVFVIMVFILKFPNKLLTLHSIPFSFSSVILIVSFILLYQFRYGSKKEQLIDEWEKVKKASS